MIVFLLCLERTTRRAGIRLLTDVHTDVVVITNMFLLLMIPPVLLGCISGSKQRKNHRHHLPIKGKGLHNTESYQDQFTEEN